MRTRKMNKLTTLLGVVAFGLVSIFSSHAQVNMNKFVKLTVKPQAEIQLDFYASQKGEQIKIVSGENEVSVELSDTWSTSPKKYVAHGETMTIYGNLVAISCNKNKENISAIDVQNNKDLERLYCQDNALTALDVSQNKELIALHCGGNKISELDIKQNKKLTALACADLSLTSLDLSENRDLEFLVCYKNKLKTLDVSNNTKLALLDCQTNELKLLDISNNLELTQLTCSKNQLTSLDLSRNSKLEQVSCYDNQFSTQTIDDIYCSLNDRTGKRAGKIFPVFKKESANHEVVLKTNRKNAKSKNWQVLYRGLLNTEVETTGEYECKPVAIEKIRVGNESLIYPNPVSDVISINTDSPIREVKVYNMQGQEVAREYSSNGVNVAHLPTGTYSIEITFSNGEVYTSKVVKR